jgi:peptidoglycan-N-acetylglucosamine deacetylase
VAALHGVANTAALMEAYRLGLQPALWTTWCRDSTARRTPDSVYRSVMRKLDGGGPILLHDSDHHAAPSAGSPHSAPFRRS